MAGGRIRRKLLEDALEYLDADQRRRFEAAASPAIAEHVGQRARATVGEWVPLSLFEPVVVLIDRVAGTGDLSLCWTIGLFVAKREVGPVQSLGMQLLRPSMIVSLAPSLFTTHFQEAGRVSIRATGDRSLLVTFTDFPSPSRPQCLTIGGWIQGWLGLGPRRSIRVEHSSCRCDGAGGCEYTAAWDG